MEQNETKISTEGHDDARERQLEEQEDLREKEDQKEGQEKARAESTRRSTANHEAVLVDVRFVHVVAVAVAAVVVVSVTVLVVSSVAFVAHRCLVVNVVGSVLGLLAANAPASVEFAADSAVDLLAHGLGIQFQLIFVSSDADLRGDRDARGHVV